MKVCIAGDGGWGTALALLLDGNGHEVAVWGPFEEYIADTVRHRENRTFLPGVSIPPSIRWTTNRAEAAESAQLLVMAVPTKFYSDVAASFADLVCDNADIVSVSKGLDPATAERMSIIASERFTSNNVSVLSGPSHAEEVAREIPTAVVIASPGHETAVRLQKVFGSRRFRVYTSDDTIGVELGGALKNVIAVAVGISDGMGFGDNTRAALITRGLAEITRLGTAMGARSGTFFGLSGMGDLVVTCTSGHSRNRFVGEQLGEGKAINDVIGSMKQVAEGVTNCKAAFEIARSHNVEAPVIEQVYSIIYLGKDPGEAVDSLLSRDFKPE